MMSGACHAHLREEDAEWGSGGELAVGGCLGGAGGAHGREVGGGSVGVFGSCCDLPPTCQ